MTWLPSEIPTPYEQQRAMTHEEFLAWSGEDAHAEWVDGVVARFVSKTAWEADVVGFLICVLGIYAERIGGELLMAPFEMRLSARSSRMPDVLYIAPEHRRRLTNERLEGPADLVIEVISGDSVTRDQVEKRREYAAAGSPEYWILDPRPGKQCTEFYRLSATGAYESVPPDADGRYYSAVVPGFWLRPAWLWREQQPHPLACLLEIAPDLLADTDRRQTGINPSTP